VPALRRTTKIRKSAYLRQGEDRPSPEEHVETMALDHDALSLLSQRFIVVDDVVTRGSQLLGAASLLAAARPSAVVVALAALRAVSSEEVASIYDPVVGRITYDGNNRVRRRP
jgi:adenine/guanine phosphoribosyltransferase-like PRPP-binding protein